MARLNLWTWQPVVVALLAVAAAVCSVAVHAAEPAGDTGAAAAPAAPATTGLVVVDAAALRAAPRDAAPLLTPLWRGEALQLRGTRGDWLQVWDVQRERGGYVRAAHVLPLAAGEAVVPDLAAQLRLLRQQPGAEALGIGVAAALIERAGNGWLAAAPGAEMLDTLVVLLDRLARRSQGATPAQQATAAAHADVAARYGFALRAVPLGDGAQQLCPNLQPAVLLRGHPAATPSQRARAALTLTRGDCIDADLLPSRRLELLAQHATWLDGIAPAALAPAERNRLLLRRASVHASLAFARRDKEAQPGDAATAFAAWSQLIPAELSEDDAEALRDAAVRLSPARWLLQAAPTTRRLGRFDLRLEAGGPGETCLVVITGTAGEPQRRCSHGAIHLASARLSPDGKVVAFAVQPLDGWTELWRLDEGGRVQVLPPASEAPGLGAVEWAGWAAGKDGAQMLVAREASAGGRNLRRFEVYGPDWGQPVRWAGDPAVLAAFQRSADGGWRAASTLAR